MQHAIAARDEGTPPPAEGASAVLPVLRALASGRALAADAIARATGIAEAEVVRAFDLLAACGLPVALPAPGSFGMPWPLDLLDGERIRGLLADVPVGGIEVHGVLDSTSAELARRGPGVPDLSFVLTEVQAAGRGRRGRGWISPPGQSLALSCAKQAAGGFAAQAGLSLVAGLCVLRALATLGIRQVGLKWPNDVLAAPDAASQGKLAGILVELQGAARGPCTAIIGIGMNLRLTPAQRRQVDQPIVDLASLGAGARLERNLVAARIIAALASGLDEFGREGFAAFHAEYAAHDLLAGRALEIADPRGNFTGVGAGVDARGALRVRLSDGSVRIVDSAGVSVRRS